MKKDTVLDKAKNPKYFIVTVILIAFGMFLVGFDANLFFFGGTFILSIIHVNPLLLGITATGFAAGITIFSIIGGFVFDKITTRNGILISLLIITTFSMLTGFVTNEYELVIYRFLVGFGTGMIQPEISAFLGDLRPGMRATTIAAEGVAFNLGLASSPYIFAQFSTATTFNIPFIIAGISGGILMLLIFLIIPSTYKIKERPKVGIRQVMNRSLFFMAISYFMFGIAFFAYEGYFTPYLISSGISKEVAASIVSFFGIAGMILAFPGAFAGDKLERKHIIQLATVVMSLGTIVMFLPHINPLLATIAVILLGGGYAIYGNIQAFAQESVEDAWIGTAVGFLFMIFNIGAMIGGPLMGFSVSDFGYIYAGIISIVTPMVLSIFFASLAPKVPKRIRTV
ncbi:hypothetical protein CM19_04225 [Candidatus Acidianus copahuensis]|uniref:Major facilitator superfamily (MFS) profile domain-containing protein n=1 Tax=Candidatus Acidianus copahuensis TaxID=1160895 RepID=A0A031LR61_9CREN|nr:MFS transporter [Candidatus Acidianus copahuensis]EZQ10316.1 hypothetical protein CM19_04225 [Candidatus Acidianus copahuensis]